MKAVSLLELAHRLRSARKAAGLSQEGVAAETGLPQPSISAIESGKRNLSTLELVKFAELYRKPVDYFLTLDFKEENKSFEPLLSARRVLDSDRAIIDDFRGFCRDYADLEQFVLGKVNVLRVFEEIGSPKTRREALELGTRYAFSLRSMFNLGSEPMYDVRLFLDAIGIKVVKRRLNTATLTGIYVYSSEFGHCVLVNRSGNRQVDRFSLAHTLCHALLDWQSMSADQNFCTCSNWLNDSLREYRANIFALNLLMPRETVERVWSRMRTQKTPSLFDVIAIARYFGVDYESTLQRLLLMDVITEKNRISLRRELASSGDDIDAHLGYTHSEVRISGEESYPDRYIKLALDAFRLGLIPPGRLAKYLGKNIYETNVLTEKMKVSQKHASA
jgi:Zn-dependent peptidase ImmA (M78 family)/transcriptional regulator with XRE-family HTH domain